MQTSADGRRDLTIRLIAEVIEVEPAAIAPTARLREDLGLDSLQSLELLSLLGEALRVELPMEEALELETVEDACSLVERVVTAHA